MTTLELTNLLKEAGIENPAGEARLLFAHFGGFSGATLMGGFLTMDSPDFLNAVERRLKREPLQYILGEVGFYREVYRVSPACLIPRSDTETLVDEAVRTLPPGICFADFCTGSGCIAISTLASRTDLTCHAYDVSEEALCIAKENAALNGVEDRILFFQKDLLHDTTPLIYDAILSNPPYIKSDVIPSLSPEVQMEPQIALDGGDDGMDFYRAILNNHIAPLVLFEIGYDQARAIQVLADAHGYRCQIRQDLGGNPRLAILTK